jgi:hypothetical protein
MNILLNIAIIFFTSLGLVLTSSEVVPTCNEELGIFRRILSETNKRIEKGSLILKTYYSDNYRNNEMLDSTLFKLEKFNFIGNDGYVYKKGNSLMCYSKKKIITVNSKDRLIYVKFINDFEPPRIFEFKELNFEKNLNLVCFVHFQNSFAQITFEDTLKKVGVTFNYDSQSFLIRRTAEYRIESSGRKLILQERVFDFSNDRELADIDLSASKFLFWKGESCSLKPEFSKYQLFVIP